MLSVHSGGESLYILLKGLGLPVGFASGSGISQLEPAAGLTAQGVSRDSLRRT